MKYVILIFLLISIPISSADTYFYAGAQALAVKDSQGDVQFNYYDRLGSDTLTKTLPFGQVIESGDRFGFTGKEQDASGLHYFAARYYDSSIGRFTSTDHVISGHEYAYVDNNPLHYTDPTGMTGVATSTQSAHWIDKALSEAWQSANKAGSGASGSLRAARFLSGIGVALSVVFSPKSVADGTLDSKTFTRIDIETLREFADRVDPAFGHMPYESLSRSNAVEDHQRFAEEYFEKYWSSHSDRVHRMTNKIMGQIGLSERLPYWYRHDYDPVNGKNAIFFVNIDMRLTLLEKDGAAYSVKQPYIGDINTFHSFFMSHHWGRFSDVHDAPLNIKILKGVELFADWMDASVYRGKNSPKKASEKLRSTELFQDVSIEIGHAIAKSALEHITHQMIQDTQLREAEAKN